MRPHAWSALLVLALLACLGGPAGAAAPPKVSAPPTTAPPRVGAPTAETSPSATPASPQARAEVEALLRRVAAAYARKDAAALASLLDAEVVVTVRGMGLDQEVRGRQRVSRHFGPELAHAGRSRLEFGQPSLETRGPLARLGADLVAWVEPDLLPGLELPRRELPLPGRLLALLEKRHGQWYFLRLTLLLPGAAR